MSGLLTSDYADPTTASAVALGGPTAPTPLGNPAPRPRPEQNPVVAPTPVVAPKNSENNLTLARRQREQGENPSRDPNAQNPYSSAGGNNQIIDGTWLELMNKHHPEMVQGQSREQILAMKTNGPLNDEMAAKYDEDNARMLASNGIAPTPNFINAAYRAGPQGAMAIIRAARENPGALVRDVAPEMATPGNNGAGNLTVGQFLMNPYQKGPGGQENDTPQQMFTIARGNQILAQMMQDNEAGKARVAALDKDYKPIEIPKPPKPPENDPLKTFSSIAGLFATLAAGFSRTPAIAAMNGLAGAMDAAKKNDWETYKAQYDQFKTSSDLAMKAHEQHSADVKDALEMMTKNMAAGKTMLDSTIALSDDEEMRKLHETQRYVEMGKLQDDRDRQAKDWALNQPVAEATLQLTAAMHNRDDAVKSGDPEAVRQADDLVKQAENYLASKKRALAGGAGLSGIGNPFPAKVDGKDSMVLYDKNTLQYRYSDGTPIPQGTEVVPAKEVREVQKAARAEGALLTSEDLVPMVDAYIAGDKSQLANIGRGAQGSENLKRFREAWAEELKKRGLTGADQAAAFVRMSSEMREAGAIGTRVGAIAVSGAEARRVASLVTQAYDKLPREQFRPYNQLVAMVANKTNSPEQAAARAADFAMVTAYARALNPSGVPRVTDIQHGEELLSASDSHESHAATVNQMLLELDQIEAATGDARNQLIDRIRGARGFTQSTQSGVASTGGAVQTVHSVSKEEEYKALPPGAWYRKPSDPSDSHRVKQ